MINQEYIFHVSDYMLPYTVKKKHEPSIHEIKSEELDELDIIIVDVGAWSI